MIERAQSRPVFASGGPAPPARWAVRLSPFYGLTHSPVLSPHVPPHTGAQAAI